MRMRALTVRQPWAWLIAAGHKPVENRGRRWGYKGPLLIHAGAAMTADQYFDALNFLTEADAGGTIQVPDRADLDYGKLVAVVSMTGCVQRHESKFFTGPYGYVLADAHKTEPMACKGFQGVFFVDVPDDYVPERYRVP